MTLTDNILPNQLIDQGFELSQKTPKDIPLDCRIAISLWKGDVCLGVSGLSYGLEEYYEDVGRFPDKDLPVFDRAMEATRDKWVITQMQVSRGTRDLRKGVNYRRVLTNALLRIAGKEGFQIPFYLSAALNFWLIPSVMEQMPLSQPPPRSCFMLNYDYTARKHHFNYDSRSHLFKQ